MGLLRNASGLLIANQTGVRPGRADDPEFHIKRLQHFGQGMGIDLTSTHSTFSNKHLDSGFYSPTSDLVTFDTHDEGLHLPSGHIEAAYDTLEESYPQPDEDEDARFEAIDELYHRAPYRTDAHMDFKEHPEIRGTTHKHLSRDIDGRGPNAMHEWGDKSRSTLPRSYLPPLHATYKDAFNQLTTDFRGFNRNREAVKPEVGQLVTRAINNPNVNVLSAMKRKRPYTLGSQFLGVNAYKDTPINDDDWLKGQDVIDLKTGTWAKIDPEGYFPD